MLRGLLFLFPERASCINAASLSHLTPTPVQAFFEEGERLDEEAKARRARLDEIKRRKLAELQAVGLEDRYCHQIKRAVETTPKASFSK